MRFSLKRFENEAVVFDSASGDTHYLAPLSFAIFQFIQEHPRVSRTEILHYLDRHYTFDSNLPPDAILDEALAGLHKIGFFSHA